VAGAFDDVANVAEACAAGAEGVCAIVGAGVDGAALLEEAAGSFFGLAVMQTRKPFSSIP
jgi:hypothetical protein